MHESTLYMGVSCNSSCHIHPREVRKICGLDNFLVRAKPKVVNSRTQDDKLIEVLDDLGYFRVEERLL